MLVSLAEADDAVQQTWLRLSRAQTGQVENLGGCLTTVAAPSAWTYSGPAPHARRNRLIRHTSRQSRTQAAVSTLKRKHSLRTRWDWRCLSCWIAHQHRWAQPCRRQEPAELCSARDVAEGTLRYARTATRFARPALIDGDPGLVVAPHGRLSVVLTIHIENAKITEINVIGQPSRLAELAIGLPDTPARDNIRENARGQIT